MTIHDAEVYRQRLEVLLRHRATRSVTLLIVPQVGELFHIARAVIAEPSGAWGIQLCRQIDSDQTTNVYETLEKRHFLRARQVLNSPENLLTHTVLHELAHLENGWGNDRDPACDGWAFEKMGLEAY